MKDFQYITNAHPAYIENLYKDYLANPESIDVDLRKFFEGFDFAVENNVTKTNGVASAVKPSASSTISQSQIEKEFSVYQLIVAYRRKGHLIAKTNPIRERIDRKANLGLENFGFSDADLDTSFEAGKFVGLGKASLRNIVAHLQKCYTHNLGVEFSSVNSRRKRDWIINAVEHPTQQSLSRLPLTKTFFALHI